jgi:molybdopterin-guanine dinucleotide biosynthesis protein A
MTGIILAGGKSKRMGFNKAFVKIGGKPLIEKIVSLFFGLFQEIIIVTNNLKEYEHLGVKVVPDIVEGKGSLGGIYTGLVYSSYQHCFVVACDMPFLNKRLISYMMKEVESYDVVVPFLGDRYESIHAVYSNKCIEHIEKLIKANKLKIINFYPSVRVKTLHEEDILQFDPDLLFKINLNTRSDLEKIRKLERVMPA